MAPKGGAAGGAAGGAGAGAAAGHGGSHKSGAAPLDLNRALMVVVVVPMLAYAFEEMDVGEVVRWVWGMRVGGLGRGKEGDGKVASRRQGVETIAAADG